VRTTWAAMRSAAAVTWSREIRSDTFPTLRGAGGSSPGMVG
jgi:hypothetical protein